MRTEIVLISLLVHGLSAITVKNKASIHNDKDIEKIIQGIYDDIESTRQENLALKLKIDGLMKIIDGLVTSAPTKRLVLHSDFDIEQVIQGLHQENQALKTEIAELQKSHWATYVRWGSRDCDGNGTEKVYSGYTGGAYYSTDGGASNSLCLPENPTWAHYIEGIQSVGARVYGTEYETVDSTFGTTAFGKPMQDQDVPCAVCQSPRTTSLMIPGSTQCYPGWFLEYSGYLMSDYYSHKAGSDFICVDKDPQGIFHGEADQNGKLLYFTEVVCGSLPCQDYPQGRELACVVCSK